MAAFHVAYHYINSAFFFLAGPVSLLCRPLEVTTTSSNSTGWYHGGLLPGPGSDAELVNGRYKESVSIWLIQKPFNEILVLVTLAAKFFRACLAVCVSKHNAALIPSPRVSHCIRCLTYRFRSVIGRLN